MSKTPTIINHQYISVLSAFLFRTQHTHPFNGPFCGTTRVSRYQKGKTVKPIWILLKQETVSDSGISWIICKSAPLSRQITMPVPQHSVFLQAGCPSCHPTNSVKALKAKALKDTNRIHMHHVDNWLSQLHLVSACRPYADVLVKWLNIWS